jgi:hypothetical protein
VHRHSPWLCSVSQRIAKIQEKHRLFTELHYCILGLSYASAKIVSVKVTFVTKGLRKKNVLRKFLRIIIFEMTPKNRGIIS